MTSRELTFRCSCGRVRGALHDLGPGRLNRAVCYCDDCQAFARWLGRQGIVDTHGGSDIVQVAQSQVSVSEGRDLLRSMRLSGKGMIRWYTDCCRSPAGNLMPSHRSPFVGIASASLDAGEGRSLDDVVGKPAGSIFGRYAVGGCPPHVHPKVPASLVLPTARFLLGSLVRGGHVPSPYFEGRRPVSAPRVLTVAERDELRP